MDTEGKEVKIFFIFNDHVLVTYQEAGQLHFKQLDSIIYAFKRDDD